MRRSIWPTVSVVSVISSFAAACAASHTPSHAAPVPATAVTAAPSSALASDEDLGGFEYRREHSGGGRFLTGGALQRFPDASLASVLRMQLPGFGGQRNAHLAASATEPCALESYVNGLWSPGAADNLRSRDAEAVEYYEATTAPPRYRRAGRACPVLLVWLKP